LHRARERGGGRGVSMGKSFLSGTESRASDDDTEGRRALLSGLFWPVGDLLVLHSLVLRPLRGNSSSKEAAKAAKAHKKETAKKVDEAKKAAAAKVKETAKKLEKAQEEAEDKIKESKEVAERTKERAEKEATQALDKKHKEKLDKIASIDDAASEDETQEADGAPMSTPDADE